MEGQKQPFGEIGEISTKKLKKIKKINPHWSDYGGFQWLEVRKQNNKNCQISIFGFL
jgi:hypothetical protein